MDAPLAGYPRVSRVGDRRDTLISPELQEERIRQHAAARGLEVEMLPPELDEGGGKADRPILEEAIRGIEEGRYSGIIVAQIDRLSRMGLEDALRTIRRIEDDAGGQVVSVAENFDVSTPEGRFSRNNILGVANMQLDRYKLGFRSAKRQAVDAGVWPFPVVPAGYVCDRRKDGGDGRLRPGDREVIAMVLRAFEARADGASWAEVGRVVGRSPSGAARLIENRAYLGEIRYEAGNGEVWSNPEAHDALVPRDLWEAAQIEHPRQGRNGSAPSLLRHIVRCAGCSCRMTIEGHGSYRCRPRSRAAGECPAPAQISQRGLDAYVEALVLPYIESLEYSAARRGRALEEAMDRLREAEDELDRFQTATKGIEPEFLVSGIRERVEAVKRGRRELGEARLAVGDLPEAGTLGERWPKMSVEQRNHVLSRSLGAVFVRKGRGVSADRVKVLARGFEPDDLPRHHGRQRVVPRPFEWVDDMPGEVSVVAEDKAEAVGRAAA
jgi:DNA invertase Pin-like site-specific DNA recombinase